MVNSLKTPQSAAEELDVNMLRQLLARFAKANPLLVVEIEKMIQDFHFDPIVSICAKFIAALKLEEKNP